MKTLFEWLIRAVLTIVVVLGLLVAYVVLFLDPNEYKQTISEQVQEATGLDLRIGGDITWSFWPSVSIQLQEVQVANPQGFSEYALLEAGLISSSVQLLPLITGKVSIDHITISDAMLNLVSNRAGESNLEAILGHDESPGQPGEPAQGSGTELRSGEITFRSVQLNMIDQKLGSVRIVTLEEASLESFTPNSASQLNLTGAIHDSSVPMLEQFGLAGFLSKAEPVLEKISLEGMLMIDDRGDQISLTQMELVTRIVGFDTDIILSADVNYKSGGDDPIELDSELKLENAKLDMNDESYDLSFEVLQFGTLTARFSLDGETLDLDRMIERVSSFSSTSDSDENEQGDGAPDWPNMVDIQGQISVGRVSHGGMLIEDFDSRINLDGRSLDASISNAQSFGGVISVELKADTMVVPADIRVTADLSQIDMAELTQHLAGSALIRSQGDVSVQLNGQGLDPGGLLKTLGGSGDYQFNAGALLGVDLTQLVDELIAQESLVGVTGAFEGETAFDSMSGTIDIEKGVLNMPDFLLLSDSFNVNGKGTLDLNAGTVDYSMQVRLLGELETKFLERYGEYSAAVLPISISGNMTEPAVGFDLEQFLAINARARIDREKDEIKDKLRGRLFDKLLGGDDDDEEGNQ